MPRTKTKPTKLYVGKLFTLKSVKAIQCHSASSDGYHDKSKELSAVQLGGRVLIIDEKAKRVKVLPASDKHPKPVWISRYYLHTEIHEEIEGNPVGELGKILNEMVTINNSLQYEPSQETVSRNRKKLEKLIRRVRLVQENLENGS
jgi:hypothetical protein